MHDNETTQITARIHWFWTGYALPMPAELPEGLAFARGTSVTMLGAARFILAHVHWLRSVEQHDPVEYHHNEDRVLERGLWLGCRSAMHLLERATKELDDQLPHIVPLRAGNGVLYASGPSPDVCEWEEIKALAERVLVPVSVRCSE